jgi:predicted enzyme related to lactoylglutathione lyase
MIGKTGSDATPARAAAVLYAADVPRLQAFYESVCGLEVAESTPDFVTLVSDRWELTMVAVPDRMAATLEPSDPPRRRSETPIKLAFAVASLADARSAALAAGGLVDGAEWAFHDAVVCDGQDPEGNVVQFRSPRRPTATSSSPARA